VNDLEKETQFYQRFLGKPTLTKNSDRVCVRCGTAPWGVARGPTKGFQPRL
jgi:hypothetical protein